MKRIYAIAFVVFALPSYLLRFSIAGIPLTVLEVFILGLFVLFCVQEYHTLFRFRLSQFHLRWYHYSIFIIVAASIFGLLTTPDPRDGLGIWKAYIIEPILFFIVCIRTIRTLQDVRIVTIALAASAGCVALVTIVQYLTGWSIPYPWHDLPGRRATAFYGYPNAVGLYLAPIAAYLIGVVMFGIRDAVWNRANRILLSTVVALSFIALLCARVEGALIGLIGSIGVMLLFTRARWFALGAGVIGVISAFAWETTRQLLLFQDVSGDVRLALWKGTWNLLQHQPIFGAGLAGFPITYDIYRLPSHVELLQYPHNIILDFWVELGIIGAVWIVAMLIISIILLMHARRQQSIHTVSTALIAMFVCIVIYGLVDVVYFKNDLSVLFWLWLSMVVFCSRQRVDKT